MNDTSELLKAVDSLLAFADGIEPIPIESTPDPDNPGCKFRPHPGAVRLSDAQEVAYLAKEHQVVRLAEACGLSDRCLAGCAVSDWSVTGFSSRPGWLSAKNFQDDRSEWNQRMQRFRAIVAELAGVPPAKSASRNKKRRRAPGELNGLALNMLMEKPEMRGATAEEWGQELKALPSQIVKLKAWTELEQYRDLQKIDRQKDRRRAGRVPGTK